MIKSLFTKKKNKKLNIVIAGGTGLIGQALKAQFDTSSTVTILSTNKSNNSIYWNPTDILQNKSLPDELKETIQHCDVLINLAGYSVGKGRFSKKHKELILNSRKDSTAAIGHLLHQLKPKKCHWIQASAIGFYGDTNNQKTNETSPNGHTFLAKVCKEWENIATISSSSIPNCKLSICRIGLVLDKNADAWKKMIIPIKLGLSGSLGTGKQWWSWIHLDDIVEGIDYLINNQLDGTYNFTSPNPLQQREFNSIIAKQFRRPSIIPTPKLALKLVLGDAADELLLSSCHASPNALLNAGYTFNVLTLKDALKKLC